MISRGVRGCEPFPTSSRTLRPRGLCTPWLPRFHASRVDRAPRCKTVFTKSFLANRMAVLVLHADILTQDALRYHRTVGSYLDSQAEHPVDLPALLRC